MEGYNRKEVILAFAKFTKAIKGAMVEVEQFIEVWEGFMKASANDSKLARNCKIKEEK